MAADAAGSPLSFTENDMISCSGIIDTHAHYLDRAFDEDRESVLSSLREAGITAIIENATDIASSEAAVALSAQFGHVYAAVGVHPEDAAGLPSDWLSRIADLSASPKIAAIGEIGLDYYWPEPSREIQHIVFDSQLTLAKDLGMPVEIHDRDAHADILEYVLRYRPSGCLHRFSGDLEMAKAAVDAGLVLGIGGALTYKNSKKEKEVVRELPLDCFILETDCPYLSPSGYRGTRCTSDMISVVVDEIAALKGETREKIIEVTTETAKKVFRL